MSVKTHLLALTTPRTHQCRRNYLLHIRLSDRAIWRQIDLPINNSINPRKSLKRRCSPADRWARAALLD